MRRVEVHLTDVFRVVEGEEFAALAILHRERPLAGEVPESTSHFNRSPRSIRRPAHAVGLRFYCPPVKYSLDIASNGLYRWSLSLTGGSSMTTPILLHRYTCLRCGHAWVPRKPILPAVCPKCTSAYWDRPRKSEVVHDVPARQEPR